ncbi:MAG: hypothetical protein KGI79_01625 [Patescibacteria group bacterium]|nr:hypothetical protein [Patescibacteria group bacterium]MDE2116556.1 hypothetical protein [Patescibacteria group bacterium]
MTLTAHAITGAAIAAAIPDHPILGFCAGFVSHYVLDAIPHTDYPIASPSLDPMIGGKIVFDKRLALDALRIGGDAVVGVALSYMLFAAPGLIGHVGGRVALIGAAAGLLPDFFHFLYLRMPYGPFKALERFHIAIQNETKRAWIGVATQVGAVAFVLFLVLYWRY